MHELASYQLLFGTYEDAKSLIGVRSAPRTGDLDVNAAMIKHYSSAIEDGNASYWDEEFAREQWGGLLSPPGLLLTWSMQFLWTPDRAAESLPIPLCGHIPLPGETVVNFSQEAEYFDVILDGDRLTMVETLLELSELKQTRLGAGHFMTAEAEFTNQHGRVVAVLTNVLYRFTPAEPEGAAT